MESLWEKQSFLSPDVIIVGAGITGLSAAATLKENEPELKVSVLERGILPSGASTKNAGFACFGSITELINDIDTLGENGMVQLVENRWKGLQKTIRRLSKEAIDLQVKSGYELLFSDDHVDEIDRINDLLHPLFASNVFQLRDEKISSFGFGKTNHLIENQLEGQLDTGKLMSSLWKYCASLGVNVHTGCEVLDVRESENEVIVESKQLNFRCKKAAICTNAFTHLLLDNSDLHLAPGRGMVLSILPQKDLLFEGTFHYEEGYYYFRDYEGKLLFGGGRNLDLSGEETTEFGINASIKNRLIQDVQEIILPDQSFEVEMEWSGIMAFGENKAPIVKPISERIVLGVRLGGMGVAIGSLVGEEVAKLLIKHGWI